MSSFEHTSRGFQTLPEFVAAHRDELRRNLLLFLGPVEDQLGRLHQRSRAHGGIEPSAFRYGPDGTFDSDHFDRSQRADLEVARKSVLVAPEVQRGGPSTSASDCYAIGAVIHLLFAEPFLTRPVGQPNRIEPSRLPLPASVREVLQRCLAPDPAQRIATVTELMSALRNAYAQNPEGAKDASRGIGKDQKSPAPSSRQIRRVRLPNASVGKQCSYDLQALLVHSGEEIIQIGIISAIATGLAVDAFGTLSGTPVIAGEFDLEVICRVAASEKFALLRAIVSLTINPDPASLWQDRRSNPLGVFPKRDTATRVLRNSELLVIAASTRGRSHAHEGKYREDDFAITYINETRWYVFVTADGAGSAEFSRRGSQVACDRTIAEIGQRLSVESDLDLALRKLRPGESAEDLEKLRKISSNHLIATAYQACVAIKSEADAKKTLIRDFATTFIVVIAKKIDFGWFFASFSVGDGGAGIMVSRNVVCPLTAPDSGDFAGQTMFLTMPQIFADPERLLSRTHAYVCRSFEFLAVMTDGITDPVFKNESNFSNIDVWTTWYDDLRKTNDFAMPDPSDQLLQSLAFFSTGNHDDRTLILAFPQTVPVTLDANDPMLDSHSSRLTRS